MLVFVSNLCCQTHEKNRDVATVVHDTVVELDMLYCQKFIQQCGCDERVMLNHAQYSHYLLYLVYNIAQDQSYFPCGEESQKVTRSFVAQHIKNGLFTKPFCGVSYVLPLKKSKIKDEVRRLSLDAYIDARKLYFQQLDDWRWEHDFQWHSYECHVS